MQGWQKQSFWNKKIGLWFYVKVRCFNCNFLWMTREHGPAIFVNPNWSKDSSGAEDNSLRILNCSTTSDLFFSPRGSSFPNPRTQIYSQVSFCSRRFQIVQAEFSHLYSSPSLFLPRSARVRVKLKPAIANHQRWIIWNIIKYIKVTWYRTCILYLNL